jgi:phosphate/sulfate permease
VGANDAANAMGTSVGLKRWTINRPPLIAMVSEFAGASFTVTEKTIKGALSTRT